MAFPVAVIPILAEIALSVTKAALDRKQADPVIARKIESEIAANPVLANELNAEKPYQSRVVVGSSGALLPAVGYLIWAFSSHGFDLAAYDPSSTFMAVMTVAGAGYALFGRLRSGLKPLFSR